MRPVLPALRRRDGYGGPVGGDLRHSCATLLFTMGVDAATVQRILRHSSITVTTGIYIDVIDEVQQDAVNGMDSLFE
ncbi:tyrosine-type recombinase/integrase [Nocardia sp. NPDC052112]|uniref:tyrosine-type recombinase/integrase n=1 Tax=Nocardia sp. NPDC052112 TaxID=3155646 RepID=UPI00342E41D4